MKKFYQKYLFVLAICLLLQTFQAAIIKSSYNQIKPKSDNGAAKKSKNQKISNSGKNISNRKLSKHAPPERRLDGPLDAMLSAMTSGMMGGLSVAPPPTPQEILPPKPIIVAPLLVRQKPKRTKMAVIRSGSLSPPMGFSPEAMARYSFDQQMGGRRLNPGMMFPPPPFGMPGMNPGMMFPPPFGMPGGNPNQISKSMKNYMQKATSNVLSALQASGQARNLHPGQTIDFEAGDIRVPSLTNKFEVMGKGDETVSKASESDLKELEANLLQNQIISSDNSMEHFTMLDENVKKLTENYEGLKGDISRYMNEINNLIERAQDQSEKIK